MVDEVESDIEIMSDVDSPSEAEITSIPDLPTRRATLLERKDDVRRNLAYASLGLLAITIVATALFIAFADTARRESWNDFLQIIIPVETLIIGGASAFY